MTGPAITAIIICLNGERFLREAIASILAQDDADWELIIVDDGSSDATAAIIAEAMAADVRIRTACHPEHANMGMSASRNLGIAEARGHYVAFLDADDVWMADKLSTQRAILDADHLLAMVYGRTKIWHSWQSGRDADDFYYDLGVEPGRAYDPPLLFEQLMENRCQSPTSCGSLIRRDAILATGGFDLAFRQMFEDQVFYARLLAQFRVHVSDKCVALYRSHVDACTAQMGDGLPSAAAHLRYLAATLAYLKGRHLASRPMLRAITNARRRVLAQMSKQLIRQSGQTLLARVRRHG